MTLQLKLGTSHSILTTTRMMQGSWNLCYNHVKIPSANFASLRLQLLYLRIHQDRLHLSRPSLTHSIARDPRLA